MKFNYLLIILFLFSCVNNNYNTSSTIFYSSKGFALVYNEQDYKNKIISKKLNTDKIEASHSKIKRNSIILITNPVNNKSVTLKVSNKSKYPDFYNVLITDKLSKTPKLVRLLLIIVEPTVLELPVAFGLEFFDSDLFNVVPFKEILI